MKKLHIKASVPVIFIKERESFIAYSPAVDLSSCGRSRIEAKNNFKEALSLFFEECISMGTLYEVLESCGWVLKDKKEWFPPVLVGKDNIKVPIAAVD